MMIEHAKIRTLSRFTFDLRSELKIREELDGLSADVQKHYCPSTTAEEASTMAVVVLA